MRSRRCVPPPHVTLQPPHDAQACHFPSTAGHGQAWGTETATGQGQVQQSRGTGVQQREATRTKELRPGQQSRSSAWPRVGPVPPAHQPPRPAPWLLPVSPRTPTPPVAHARQRHPPQAPRQGADLGTAAGSSPASPPSGPGTRRRRRKARCTPGCAAGGPGNSWRSTCSSLTTHSSFRPLPGPGGGRGQEASVNTQGLPPSLGPSVNTPGDSPPDTEPGLQV